MGNASGICTDEKTTGAKSVAISGFSLYAGVTVRVMFQNGNSYSSTSSLKLSLSVNSTGSKEIRVVRAGSLIAPSSKTGYWRGASSTSFEMWQPYTILDLMYDGTYWVIIGNPVVESYYSANSGYNVYADGKIECWGQTTSKVTSGNINYPVQYSQVPIMNGTFKGDNDTETRASAACTWLYPQTTYFHYASGWGYGSGQASEYIMWTARGY